MSSDVKPERLPALDLMRGFVMVLMALDHAMNAFCRDHFHADSAFLWQKGDPLPALAFLTRWVTHLCAPTFLFLMGAGVALGSAKRARAGASPREIDRWLLTRGALLAALDPLWMWWAFGEARVALGVQVLFAIGVAMMALAWLRRLSTRALVVGALVFLLLHEGLCGVAMLAQGFDPAHPTSPILVTSLLLTGGLHFGQRFGVVYPVLPWLAVAVLGFAFGRRLPAPRAAPFCVCAGLASLALFALVRGLDGYGNMMLARDGWGLLQWLHVSKYPPSLSYFALELGLMVLVLALLFALGPRLARWRGNPLLVLGRTAPFFYLLHVHALSGAALALGMFKAKGHAAGFVATLACVLVFWPLCAGYLRLRSARGYR